MTARRLPADQPALRLPFRGGAMRSVITNFRLGLAVCIMVIGLYNALFFDRYLPLCEGWHSVYAHYLLNGALPYRDFHFFLPPLYPLMVAGFTSVFGPDLILLRIAGVGVMLSMTITVYLLFSRLFPPHISCVATLVSIIYYQSCVVHIGYDYLNFVTLFAVLGTLFICRHYDYDGHPFRSRAGLKAALFLFMAGVLGIAAFMVKQSGGLFVVAFSFLAVAVVGYAKGGWRKAIGGLVIYSAGVLVPMLILFVWLVSNGILLSFWDQVIVGASSSKGGLTAILFAWIPRLFNRGDVIVLMHVVLAIIVLRVHCLPQGFMLGNLGGDGRGTRILANRRTVAAFSIVLVIFTLCIVVPFWYVGLSYSIADNDQLEFLFNRVPVIVGSTACMLLFLVFLFRMVRERRTSDCDAFILLTVSLGLIWGCGTAAGIGEVALILVAGLLIGMALNVKSRFNVARIGCALTCLLLLPYMTSFKYINPYNWWGLDEPDIRTGSAQPQPDYLRGFAISDQTARIYSEVTAIVTEATDPGDAIYTFPNIPIFYLLTDRYPDTFGIISWFDVEPDRFAVSDAARLLESPPKVIIYLEVPEFVWEGHEGAFRGGLLSGQRQIKEAIVDLTSSGDYRLDAKYDVPDGYALTVWTLIEE